MTLSKFKYVGGKDTGINPDKSKTLYGIVFPLGKDVEVPDDVAHKLRSKAGDPKDEFVETHVGADKSEVELNQEKERKAASKDVKSEKLTPDELEDLKAKAAKEDARVAKVQADARLGR